MLSRPEILNVAVGAEPDVVRQVPTNVIGIRVNDDVIGIPEPVAAGIIIIRSDTKEKAAEPEAISRPAGKPVDVAAADFTREMSMLPRVIQVVVRIVWTSVVTNPLIVIRVNVRGRRMSALVAVVRMLIALRRVPPAPSVSGWNRLSYRRRTVRGNVPLANRRSLRGARGGPRLLLPRLLLFVGPLLSKSGD